MFFQLVSSLLALSIILPPAIVDSNVIAEDMDIVEQSSNAPTAPTRINFDNINVKVQAISGIAIDEASGAVLWQKKPDIQRPMASITKLVTALVTLKSDVSLNTTVTILGSDERNGTKRHIRGGDKLKIGDILATALVGSNNTAAVALGRVVGNGNFIKIALDVLQELGFINTQIVEPSGLSARNISTAREIAHIATRVFEFPEAREAMTQKQFVFTATGRYKRVVTVHNTNELLQKQWPRVLIGKTGYINESGYNFVAQSENEQGDRIIVVLLGAPSNEARFQDTKSVIHWVFENWEWQSSEEAQTEE